MKRIIKFIILIPFIVVALPILAIIVFKMSPDFKEFKKTFIIAFKTVIK